MPASAYKFLSIYITAHPDDWQLFMMPNAVNDLFDQSKKVVWIQLTAGDAGLPSPYWLAREQGAISSIRYVLAQADGGYFIHSIEREGTLDFHGHPIRFWSSKNAVGYYLRLPDGNLDGSGYQVTGNESLRKLVKGEKQEIAAIDGTNKYTLPNLVATLNAIISYESSQANLTPESSQANLTLTLNYQNPDTALNIGDHSDHTNTGLIVQQMPLWQLGVSVLYLDYVVNTFPPDIAIADLYWKASLFAAYEKSVHDLAGHSDSNPKYEQFCLRTAHWSPGIIIAP